MIPLIASLVTQADTANVDIDEDESESEDRYGGWGHGNPGPGPQHRQPGQQPVTPPGQQPGRRCRARHCRDEDTVVTPKLRARA